MHNELWKPNKISLRTTEPNPLLQDTSVGSQEFRGWGRAVVTSLLTRAENIKAEFSKDLLGSQLTVTAIK